MNEVSILVVDDDDDVRSALLDELSSRYDVTSAACGGDAIAALSERPFDVVISDLRMPDHDGIEVLDFARSQHDGIIRILLTGYADDRAHEALMRPDAPYKVGKPWYDEIEVILARALEQRRRTRQLSASLSAAFSVAQLESSLSSTESFEELAEVLVLRGVTIEGVTSCAAVFDGRVIAGQLASDDVGGWRFGLPIDGDGRLRFIASGHGDESRELVMYLARLAQQRGGILVARESDASAHERPPRSRLDELMRQATLGARSGAVLHDVAGILQGLAGAVLNLMVLAEDRGDDELRQALEEVQSAADEATELFVAMRKYQRDGRPSMRLLGADAVVARVLRQAGGLVRERATLRVGAAPDAWIEASEPLCVQTLDAVLRNAAAASPPGGQVDLEIVADDDQVRFVITDDGPGVAPEIANLMFELCTWQRPGRVGTGLAMAAHVLAVHGGTISYRRAPGRGACFTVALPRVYPGA